MKVGDYVRTINGEIYKLIDDFALIYFQKEQEHGITEHQIIKSSPNIIDLIEVGDYVNGWRITTIDKRNNKLYSEYEDGYLIKRIKDKNIERIVTKEQMKAMQYEVK